jgi:hypothetical protein
MLKKRSCHHSGDGCFGKAAEADKTLEVDESDHFYNRRV